MTRRPWLLPLILSLVVTLAPLTAMIFLVACKAAGHR